MRFLPFFLDFSLVPRSEVTLLATNSMAFCLEIAQPTAKFGAQAYAICRGCGRTLADGSEAPARGTLLCAVKHAWRALR
jgi:hypothetical protein